MTRAAVDAASRGIHDRRLPVPPVLARTPRRTLTPRDTPPSSPRIEALWDATLSAAMAERRVAVHEEAVVGRQAFDRFLLAQDGALQKLSSLSRGRYIASIWVSTLDRTIATSSAPMVDQCIVRIAILRPD